MKYVVLSLEFNVLYQYIYDLLLLYLGMLNVCQRC